MSQLAIRKRTHTAPLSGEHTLHAIAPLPGTYASNLLQLPTLDSGLTTSLLPMVTPTHECSQVKAHLKSLQCVTEVQESGRVQHHIIQITYILVHHAHWSGTKPRLSYEICRYIHMTCMYICIHVGTYVCYVCTYVCGTSANFVCFAVHGRRGTVIQTDTRVH